MLESLPLLLTPLLVLLVLLFLFFRLGYFASRDLGGRGTFMSGGILIFAVTVWQALKISPQYYEWFIEPAYPIIDVALFAVLALGLLLVVTGLALYADSWQMKREDIDVRQGKLSVLENLQHDARQPYHLLELLNLSLKEVLSYLPGASGALFLVNQKQRRFVLTTSSGLKTEETALLEYYPMERNVISQAVEIGDPMLMTQFELPERSGETTPSRFNSCLILPMTSGLEKVGVMLLLSEQKQFFSRTDIRFLAPVANWLGEKVRSARLIRELTQTRNELNAQREELSALSARYLAAGAAVSSNDAVGAFCQALTGFIDAESSHLCGLRQGGLVFYGGSEPLTDLTENYRTALVDAIDRTKPLIINQEAGDGDDGHSVLVSTLVFPLNEPGNHDALLFVRSGRPFSVTERELKQTDSLASLARLVLRHNEYQRLRLTRRKGLDAILRLLKPEPELGSFRARPQGIVDYLSNVLPNGSLCMAFVKQEGGELRFEHGTGFRDEDRPVDFELAPGEGTIGKAAVTGECRFAYGRTQIAKSLDGYEPTTRAVFNKLWGERGLPTFHAVCPVASLDGVQGVVSMALYDVDEKERAEWERLLILASGLYSLRLTIDEIEERRRQAAESIEPGEAGVARGQNVLGRIVQSVLGQTHVSGDLYMAGRRPREIKLQLADTSDVLFSSEGMRTLFESTLNRFAALAEDEDIITVATYERDEYVYLDVSRHHRNFPPVEQVAGFGKYQATDEAYRHRPGDVYLRHALGRGSFYAFDSDSASPTFLSFKFPVKRSGASQTVSGGSVRILAIDDQAVILDLISAMGQSLGYTVRTCQSGAEALRYAEKQTYDVILVDHSLGDMTGLEVVRRLRQHQKDAGVILITGWDTRLDQSQLARAGVVGSIVKPFKLEQLTEAVQAAVSKSAPR